MYDARTKMKLTIEHDGRREACLAHISRLLPQLTHGSLFGRLALVYQTGRDLNGDLVNGRAELLLQYELGSYNAGETSRPSAHDA